MRRSTQWACLTLALGLGLTAVVVTVAGLSTVLAAGQADVTIDLTAPAHVAPNSQFVVNIAYANIGTEAAPDVQVTATLPDGVVFITATDRWDAPLLPASVIGNVLVWDISPLPPDSCCGHIFITEQVDGSLAEGTPLTNTATIATTAVESDTTNNTASVVSVVCDMAGSVKQVYAGEIMPGDVLTYTIVLDLARRSGGPQQVQERIVELSDTLPFSHQVRFLGWTGDVTGTHDGQTLQWQGHVRAGEPLTLQYRLGVEGVITPSTVLTNLAHLRSLSVSGTMQLGPVTTVVTLPHGAMALGPYQGGELQHEYGVTLTVPPGAVTDTTRFQFKPLTDTDIISGPPGLMFAHRAFEVTAFRFGQGVHQFGQPLTITANYSDADIAGLNRETLRLWYRNGPGEPWAMLGEPMRAMSGSRVYTTTHLTQFALFSEAMPDLALDLNAPDHVAPGSQFVVNVSYKNVGVAPAPNTWITATLPGGTQFITSTDRWGAPLPPDVINGATLAWNVGAVLTGTCCQHILITEQVNNSLSEGDVLTTTAVIATSATESDLTNNADSAASVVCDMAGSAKQVHAGQGMPGDVLTYTLIISRAQRSGGGSASTPIQVWLTDTLPFSHQVRFLGWTSDVTGTHDGQMLCWQGQVRAGEPLTLQYRLGVEGVITPGDIISSRARLSWSTGEMQLGPVTTVVTLPHGALALGPYQGGELRHEYGVTLTVPPGAVTDTTRFQFKPLTDTDVISGPPGLMFAHRAFEVTAFRFGQGVHQFGQPLTLTLNYSDTDVAGLKRETLRLWYRNGQGEPWAMLGEPARVMSGTHVYTTTHLTQFALFVETAYRVFLPMVIR